MEKLVQALMRHTKCPEPGEAFAVGDDRLTILRSDHPRAPGHILFRRSLCIVAQGSKWANFGTQQLEYKAGQALVVGVETPSVGRVSQASPDQPCLVLIVELDVDIMRDVAREMNTALGRVGGALRGMLVADFGGELADCATRLVDLLDRPQAYATLYPAIMREMCFWLLNGPQGAEIASVTLMSSPAHALLETVKTLRDRYREVLRVDELAAQANLSVSAYHRNFKALTCLTPLQYQKQLRLMEARRLMVTCGMNVESACFDVGYESPSQFSREYARMFGAPPRRDIVAQRETLGLMGEGAREPTARAAHAVHLGDVVPERSGAKVSASV